MVEVIIGVIILLIIVISGVAYYFLVYKTKDDTSKTKNDTTTTIAPIITNKPRALSEIDTSGNVYTEAQFQSKYGEFIGKACSINEDCPGWMPGVPGALKCCNGACTKQRRDLNGVGQCPDVCVMDYGLLPGTCPESAASFDIPLSDEGGACQFNSQCRAHMNGVIGSLKCCGGICTKQIPDYLKRGQCPAECKARENDPPGSCSTALINREIGESCIYPADCKNHMPYFPGRPTCCNGVCTTQIADWANVGRCPSDCKGTISGQVGTCELFSNKVISKYISDVDNYLIRYLNA